MKSVIRSPSLSWAFASKNSLRAIRKILLGRIFSLPANFLDKDAIEIPNDLAKLLNQNIGPIEIGRFANEFPNKIPKLIFAMHVEKLFEGHKTSKWREKTATELLNSGD